MPPDATTPAGAVTVIEYRPPIVGVNVIVPTLEAAPAEAPGITDVNAHVLAVTAVRVKMLLAADIAQTAVDVTSKPFGSSNLKVGAIVIVLPVSDAAFVVTTSVAVVAVPAASGVVGAVIVFVTV
jgi:hypothetical protein